MLAVFLGAGFSRVGGVPLASELFDTRPEVDRITRRRLVESVVSAWELWHTTHGGTPEEYLAVLQQRGGRTWHDAVWFVGLAITLRLGRVRAVGTKPTIVGHNIDRTTQVPAHEQFWSTVFRCTSDVVVVTTNYDVLPERGLRHRPRPRVPRPGFNYGSGPEQLQGGGYPSYSHIQRIVASGSVPLLKLHGSVSWAVRKGGLVHYHDCRPAIRGDATILAPVVNKSIPSYLQPTWDLAAGFLAAANTWVVVGYSLPAYDRAVRDLLRGNAAEGLTVHVFDPDDAVPGRFVELLEPALVHPHPGLPEGLAQLGAVMTSVCS